MDIKEGEVRELPVKLGGIKTINPGTNTVIVCADDEIHTSDHCVRKEWIFQCIVDGVIKPILRQDETHVSDSEDDNSVVLGFEAFTLNKKITVQTSRKVYGQKRCQKLQACVYCGKLATKISRHLQELHSDEPEIAKICNLKKGSKERRKAWIKISAKGNNAHNNKVKKHGCGMIIPKYRPSQAKESLKYLPCEYCMACIVDRDLWKHHKICVAKPTEVKSDGPVRNSRLLLPVKCSDQLHRNVISKLRDDHIAAKIMSDQLILEFGQRRYDKTGKHQHAHQHIAQRMRELGRFVIRANKLDPSLQQLSDCIKAIKWKTVFEAVKCEAGFDKETLVYGSPSFAIKCGHSLKKCAKILRNEANETGDGYTREMCSKFLENYDDEWSERVDAPARDCLSTATYNRTQLLPIVEDVVTLSSHIKNEIKKVKAEFTGTNGKEVYSRLSKLILAQVILFNRKRAGEASRLTQENFSKGLINPDVDDAVKQSLSKFEQKLCEYHTRVETRGKRGRKVAVLFTTEMKENMELLLNIQTQIEGWKPEKIFVPINYQIPYRGSKVLKDIAKEANLKAASRITSTNLRKQLATMSQVLELTETDQDVLARFMGHDIRIHRDFYRLPQGALEVAKVSKVLHLINTGKIGEVAGKHMNEIDVNESVDFEPDSGLSDDDEGGNQITDDITADPHDSTTISDLRPQKEGKRSASSSDEDFDDDVKDADWKPSNRKISMRLGVLDDSDKSDTSDDDVEPQTIVKKKNKESS